MTNPVTLEQVEALAEQLPPREQLKLVAHIGKHLSSALSVPLEEPAQEQVRQRVDRAEALLAELDAVAESIEGEFDAAQDVRAMREERTNRL